MLVGWVEQEEVANTLEALIRHLCSIVWETILLSE